MKFHIRKTAQSEQGSILLVMLMVALILGITLASYLIMAQNQNASVMRSQVWNSAIPISEAGIEDALQLLNKYSGAFEKVTNWPTTVAEDSWSVVAPNVFYVRRYFSENYYDVYVTNSPWMRPTVKSVGYAMWRNPYGNTPVPFPAAVGVDYNYNGRSILPRGVTIETRIEPLFAVAMAAKQVIDFNGKNVQTDSFNSALTNNSAWNPALGYGTYPAGQIAKLLDHGDVVTDATIINSLNVGNAKIMGQVKTGPKGTVAIGPGGSVGDKNWVTGGSTGIQPGHASDDMNVLFPDAILPETTWMPVAANPTTINGVNYQYVFTSSGDYTLPGIPGSVFISTNVSVRLKVTADVNLTGNNEIHLAPKAKLKIYMLGSTFKLAGNGVVNESGNADNFYYIGLPTNTALTFQGNADFVGAIYAPSAAFTLGGGGANTYDFIGASVTKSVKMNGHFKFHYDENLRDNGMGRGFVPTRWRET